ncbi:hypothetical protein Hanom_Chr05g00425891 [Helianthus anomalus]
MCASTHRRSPRSETKSKTVVNKLTPVVVMPAVVAEGGQRCCNSGGEGSGVWWFRGRGWW